jgi:SAM-dependent methyltransferase
MREYVPCNFCKRDDSREIAKFLSRDLRAINQVLLDRGSSIIDAAETFKVVRCRACRLVYINPRLSYQSLSRFYDEYYANDYSLSDTKSIVFDGSPYDQKNVFQERSRLQSVHTYRKPPGLLLDVGCSTGFFLGEAVNAGWEGYGIDISPPALDEAKQRHSTQVVVGELKSAPFPQETFDVITMHAVLEHTTEPFEVLKAAKGLLKPGGLLVFVVPNVKSFEYWVFRRRWVGFIFEHLYYFSPAVIRKMLSALDLETVQITSRHFSQMPKDSVLNELSLLCRMVYARARRKPLLNSNGDVPSIRRILGLGKWMLVNEAKPLLEYSDLGGKLCLGNVIYVYARKPELNSVVIKK